MKCKSTLRLAKLSDAYLLQHLQDSIINFWHISLNAIETGKELIKTKIFGS